MQTAASAAGASPAMLRTQLAKFLLSLILLAATPAISLHAQGCAQCLDSTRATPPQVQSAYRHAIFLLAGAASTLFLTGILLLRNRQPR